MHLSRYLIVFVDLFSDGSDSVVRNALMAIAAVAGVGAIVTRLSR